MLKIEILHPRLHPSRSQRLRWQPSSYFNVQFLPWIVHPQVMMVRTFRFALNMITEHCSELLLLRAAPSRSLRAIAREYDVPRTTLRAHVRREVRPNGRPTILSDEDETVLARWCEQRARSNSPVTMREVRHAAALIAQKRGGPHFRGSHAGRGWLKGFIRRHPENGITHARSSHAKLPTSEEWQAWHHTIRVYFL
jgi:hypothetical protein